MTWDSSWGKGRPGWHIEDTAITENCFGAQYDIHGGAMDLLPSPRGGDRPDGRCLRKESAGEILDAHRLSQCHERDESLGNFTTIRDMLREYEADAFRFFVLLAHYRSPIDFSEKALEQARKSLERIRQAAKIIEEQLEKAPESSAPEQMDPAVALAKAKFLESMDNDFNVDGVFSSTTTLLISFWRWMIMADQLPAKSLDMVGLYCPVPLFKTREGIDSIKVGEVLEVIADDPAAEEDITRFVKRTGHELVKFENNEGVLRFLIRKKK